MVQSAARRSSIPERPASAGVRVTVSLTPLKRGGTVANVSISGHYYCALTTLRSSLDALQSIPVSPENIIPPNAQQRVPLALITVLESAKFLRYFRQKYGFKSALAFIFQAAAVVSSILLNNLGTSSTLTQDPTEELSNLQIDVESAFDESYRCLLAIGTRFMIGRGVARMVYHTSRTAKKPLPTGTFAENCQGCRVDFNGYSTHQLKLPKLGHAKKSHQCGRRAHGKLAKTMGRTLFRGGQARLTPPRVDRLYVYVFECMSETRRL